MDASPQRHARQHHRFFTDQHMALEGWQDCRVVLFPAVLMVFFFGAFAVLALGGTFLIDRKRRISMGENWSRFAASTSNLPFAAVTLNVRLAPRADLHSITIEGLLCGRSRRQPPTCQTLVLAKSADETYRFPIYGDEDVFYAK